MTLICINLIDVFLFTLFMTVSVINRIVYVCLCQNSFTVNKIEEIPNAYKILLALTENPRNVEAVGQKCYIDKGFYKTSAKSPVKHLC